MCDIETLVLIDHNAIDQQIYRRILERSGRIGKVVSFRRAEEALAYLASDDIAEPDLILLDINMPVMDGFEFLEALGSRGRGADMSIVVMLTTSLGPEDAERAKGYSVVKDFLHKPLSAGHLDRLIALVQ